MIRKSKRDEVKLDISKPIAGNETLEAALSDEENCFGKMWSLSSNECSMCSLFNVCGIYFDSRTLQKKISEKESKYGPFLDQADLSLIDTSYIEKKISEGDYTVAKLIKYAHKASRLTDEVAIIEWIKRYFVSNKLKTENGIIKRK